MSSQPDALWAARAGAREAALTENDSQHQAANAP